MPKPELGEGRDHFATRCIPIVLEEHPELTNRQAAGRCYGIYDQHHGKKTEKEEEKK